MIERYLLICIEGDEPAVQAEAVRFLKQWQATGGAGNLRVHIEPLDGDHSELMHASISARQRTIHELIHA